MAAQVNTSLSIDIAPPAGNGLDSAEPNVVAQFSVTEQHDGSLVLAAVTPYSIPFGNIAAAQLLFIKASVPIKITLTVNSVSIVLSGTHLLLELVDPSQPISAAVVEGIGAGITPTVEFLVAA